MSGVGGLGLIALVVGLAVAAEMLGDRLGVPNFLFFVLAGVLVGPPGLGLLHHDVFGESLEVVVGLGIAIILFHSGSSITIEALRKAPQIVHLLATVGILVTFLGSAAVTFLVMDVTAELALLIGALLVATGTTVIEPLLATVPVCERLAYALDIEATVTEVMAGILAMTVFHAFALGEPDSGEFVFTFAWTLLVGVLVGGVVATGAWLLLTVPKQAPERAPKHATQLYLATAVVTFTIAESIAQEAGVAAAAIAGIVLGNADLPYREHIEEFEEDFTTFIIAFVFVALASFVEPDWLATVGFEGVLVAVVVIGVVRPLAVFLSTMGAVLSTREKLFLSSASPRGIIPAGLATLLAIEIQGANPEAAAYITGTVFLVILASTTVEGVFAGRIAEWLDVTTDTTVIVGGGRLGLALADQYVERGERVHLVETDQDTLEMGRSAGFPVYVGDGTDEDVLRNAEAGRATRVVAATDDDEANLEVARLARSEFGVETVLARVNHADNRPKFEALDARMLTGSQLDLWALDHLADQPAPDWLTALSETGGMATVSLADDVATTVADLDRSLSERSFVLALTRDRETWIPDGAEPVEYGDRLTVVGRADAVEEAIEHLTHVPENGSAGSRSSTEDDGE